MIQFDDRDGEKIIWSDVFQRDAEDRREKKNPKGIQDGQPQSFHISYLPLCLSRYLGNYHISWRYGVHT
jgi:hypothetical protein